MPKASVVIHKSRRFALSHSVAFCRIIPDVSIFLFGKVTHTSLRLWWFAETRPANQSLASFDCICNPLFFWSIHIINNEPS